METHKYSNGNINVIWQPQKCIHAGICVKMLPNVYDPKARPWIKAENATSDELKNQINQCPSGALTYELKTEK
ncbi:MAG: (4Fe-4S)-binding protein [Chryseobacterium sp.]|jgi:uncharacterized Fe-S cluster protein YjdI|uniref:(4Fe-4S)-binding protein n=1 Tax=Chryseobacterium sp. TaxID=1871047 RepID=UPI002623E83D|nr:(4Fe-4S)-binding protein [Chryseobacterium sp.]MDF2553140.1 (4Fe-4S)-binding protein [Chryseobacterium sp.]MDF2932264.1 (4Fe-4S)-binding protein [Chryseobacterium sp.]